MDRIEEVRLLDEPAQATLWVDSDIPERIFHPDPQIPPVTLILRGGARWVAEYYPMDEITDWAEEPDALRVTMRVGGDEWLVRLVLSLGGDALIVDRPDLATLVAQRATDALAAYAPH